MTFTVETSERCEVLDVTDEVAAAVPDGADGVATVFVRHTTAGVTVNEAEDRLLGDLEDALAALVPRDGPDAAGESGSGWAHDALDGNADSHVRAMLVGASETVPVREGDLATGTWQSVLLVECDGPRTRTVDVVVTA
jgi:secondary thiamine-phosphate synthase enzyme